MDEKDIFVPTITRTYDPYDNGIGIILEAVVGDEDEKKENYINVSGITVDANVAIINAHIDAEKLAHKQDI